MEEGEETQKLTLVNSSAQEVDEGEELSNGVGVADDE